MSIGSSAARLTSTRRGAILLGIAAAVLAAVILVAYISWYRSSVESAATPTQVLTANRLIARGTPGSVIAAKQLYETATVAEENVKAGAITDPAVLSSSVASVDIFPGQQLTANDFTTGAVAAGVTATLPGNQRAISISLDALSGSLANLQTGDRVDIYQQVQSGDGQLVKLFRGNVLVLQSPGATEGGVVILQVPSLDVADYFFAAKHTQLMFALRPSTGGTPTRPSTADESTMLRYSRTHR
jgi:Flp pilus assembly protein CpaB